MASYEFWKTALADPSKIGTDALPVHESHPQYGFYRTRDIDGGDMVPVAIWFSQKLNEVIAKVGDKVTRDVSGIWSFCCRHPVTEQEYRDAMEGKGWPDTPPVNEALSKQQKKDIEIAERFTAYTTQIAKIGDNLPDDPFEALKIEYEGELEAAKDLLKEPVKDQDQANKIANFSKRVSVLGKKADELFTVEKRPHLDASRAVDDKWREIREGAKSLATSLKRHLDAFLAEQRRIEQERQRQAAIEAENARRKAEEAAKAAQNVQANPNDPEEAAKAAEAKRLAEEAAAKEKAAKAQVVSAGRTGSKVSMRKFKSAEITDYDKLVNALKGRDEMKELVQSLANRAAKADIELAGMKIIEEERAV